MTNNSCQKFKKWWNNSNKDNKMKNTLLKVRHNRNFKKNCKIYRSRWNSSKIN